MYFCRKQQKDLEKKLKDLEEKEAKLKQNNNGAPVTCGVNSNLNTKITSSGGIDSGNDHNYCSSDASVLTSPPTTGRKASVSEEDRKRIEYQKMILQTMNDKKSKHLKNGLEIWM